MQNLNFFLTKLVAEFMNPNDKFLEKQRERNQLRIEYERRLQESHEKLLADQQNKEALRREQCQQSEPPRLAVYRPPISKVHVQQPDGSYAMGVEASLKDPDGHILPPPPQPAGPRPNSSRLPRDT